MSSRDANVPPMAAPLSVERHMRAARLRASMHRVWHEHRMLLLVCVVYGIASYAIGPAIGYRAPALWPYVAGTGVLLLGATPFVLAIWTFAERLRHERAAGRPVPPSEGWHEGWRRVRLQLMTTERIGGVLIVGTCMAIVLACVAGWRSSIPFIHPFAYDSELAVLDRALHGGVDPWRWTHQLFGAPAATRVLAWLYGLAWGAANVGVVLALAFAAPSFLRRRVLVAYVLEYALLGSLLATLVSSAGPVYYAGVTDATPANDPFAPLVAYLARMDADGGFMVRQLQDRLWAGYDSGTGFGITAFPSIHVSSAALLAFAGSATSRRLGILGWTLCATTLLTSVHLGWHYAVDGYASILGMALIWWLAGRMTRRGR